MIQKPRVMAMHAVVHMAACMAMHGGVHMASTRMMAL